MSTIKPNMQLTVWDSATDTFNYSALATNFTNIDKHDHGANGGAPIDGTAIQANSIDGSKIKDGSIDAGTKLKPGSITRSRIRPGIEPEVVTTLPSRIGLDDGYEVYYRTTDVLNQSMSNALWHLRLNQTSSRWEFVGGTPVSDYMETGVYYLAANRSNATTASYEQVTISSNPLSVTVPPGYYHVTATGRGSLTYPSSGSASAIMYLSVGSSAPSNDNLAASFAPPITDGTQQTNLATTMTVVNNVLTTSADTEIKVWTDMYHGTTGTSSPGSNITVGSITATPIYLNA